MTFAFIGAESIVGSVGLQNYGQRIELSKSVARDVVLGGGAEQGYAGAVPLIPADQFDTLGLTPQEIQQFGSPGARAEAPKAVRDKFQAAVKALAAYRAELENPAPAPDAQKTTEPGGEG